VEDGLLQFPRAKTNQQKLRRPFERAKPTCSLESLGKLDTIFLPIHLAGSHWTVCSIYSSLQLITFWNSILGATKAIDHVEFDMKQPLFD
jgi:hypothetical protein